MPVGGQGLGGASPGKDPSLPNFGNEETPLYFKKRVSFQLAQPELQTINNHQSNNTAAPCLPVHVHFLPLSKIIKCTAGPLTVAGQRERFSQREGGSFQLCQFLFSQQVRKAS